MPQEFQCTAVESRLAGGKRSVVIPQGRSLYRQFAYASVVALSHTEKEEEKM